MKINEEFADLIFTQRFAKDANAGQIADAASATWRDINTALSPVIGQHGVVALIKRSLHLQHIYYPALKSIQGTSIVPDKFSALYALLIEETATNAVLINSALLNTFYGLLANLISASLTNQLLHSVFTASSNGDPVQDILL